MKEAKSSPETKTTTDGVVSGQFKASTATTIRQRATSLVATTKRVARRHPRRAMAVAATTVLVLGVLAYGLASNSSDNDTTAEDNGPTLSVEDPRAGINEGNNPEELKDAMTKLQENKPGWRSSKAEKASYYNQLAQLYADRADYQKAIETMQKEEQEAGDAMPYQDYYAWAYYYERVGNKQAAIGKLNVMLTHLPDTDANDPAYSKQKATARINTYIQELSS